MKASTNFIGCLKLLWKQTDMGTVNAKENKTFLKADFASVLSPVLLTQQEKNLRKFSLISTDVWKDS